MVEWQALERGGCSGRISRQRHANRWHYSSQEVERPWQTLKEW
jgi:hypothetical protein